MGTLRSLISKQAPLLLVDAASSRIQVGVIKEDGEQRWAASEEESGVALFRLLEQLGVRPLECAGFIYCSGPGSILGIRTSAMAIRTWCALSPRPVWSYCSLELFAEAQKPSSVLAIADARRDSWHVFEVGGKLHRLASSALPADRDYCTPQGFRRWSPLPAGLPLRELPYGIDALWAALPDADLLRPDDAPDAFLHEDPSYATWTPQIHRAPAAS